MGHVHCCAIVRVEVNIGLSVKIVASRAGLTNVPSVLRCYLPAITVEGPDVNRSELERRVTRRTGCSQSREVIDAFLSEVMLATSEGDVVRLHRFGRFVPRVRSAGCKPHPRTGAPMEFPERISVAFLPSGSFKGRLNPPS